MGGSNSNLRKYTYYFGIAMVIVYVSLGLLLVFYEVPINITSNARIIAGCVFIIYGFIRGYTIYRRNRQQDED